MIASSLGKKLWDNITTFETITPTETVTGSA